MNIPANIEIIEVSAFKTWIGEDDICVTVVKPNSEITIKEALENTEAVIKLSQGKCYPLLVDTRQIKSISKEARDYFSMRERKGNVKAIGMLVDSPLSKIIGNFFLGLNKPKVPTQLFVEEKQARIWLKKYL